LTENFVDVGGFEVATDPLTVACHNYAVQKLKEKFGPSGNCTMLDYVKFYGEKLKELQKQ